MASQKQGPEAEGAGLEEKLPTAPYQWKVIALDESNNRALAVTKDVVAKMPYHEPGGDITWEGCTLRKWLNNDFYDGLPAHIKSRVVEVVNQNPDNGTIPGGNPTRDKVFLLSIDEANRYFKSDSERIAKFEGAGYWWWLRSPGDGADYAASVSYDGDVNDYGFDVIGDDGVGVRPALWLSL